MKEKNKFDLVPYISNIKDSGKINSLNQKLVSNIEETIIKIVKKSDAILMHECDQFENFSGRDIDTFYLKNKKFLDIEIDENFIFHKREKGSFRFLINQKEYMDFFSVDVEDLAIFSPSTPILNTLNIDDSITCKKTGLKHFKLNALIYYKLVKYFSYGVVFSYEQLFKLKRILNLVEINQLENILKLISKNLPQEIFWIKKLIDLDFSNFEKDNNVKNFWIEKRIIRQKKRKIFAGKIKLKNLIRSKRFIYALIFGSLAVWSKKHNPLPAIAIVGNDGAGKTTICNYVIKNFSKMDPAYFNMKSDLPLMPFTKFMNKFLRKLINHKIIQKIFPIRVFLSILGQSIDLLDQYIKYRLGMAFADSGHGVTIFERYITDKLRGEFPNKKNKFLPLEQFFPFPDGMFYIDVKPEISVSRKLEDMHTIEEMKSKRANYISLLKEFSEVKTTSSDNDLKENIKSFKNYIFELGNKKKKTYMMGKKFKRCIWKKNRNRVLDGDPKERFQKGSFL